MEGSVQKRMEACVKERNPSSSQEHYFIEEYRIIRPDGEIRWIKDSSFPVFDDEGELLGFTGVAQDVTAEKQTERLRREKAIAEATTTRLRAVAGSIAHQVTNPLTAVKIAYDYIYQRLQILTNNYHKAVRAGAIQPNLTEDEIQKIEHFSAQINYRIKEAGFIIGHHLVNINENRWHTSIDKLLLKPQLMSEIIKNALKAYPFLSQQRRDLIHWQKGSDFSVLAEKDLLMHVLLNLIDNALKSIEFVGKGEISIWLENGTDYNFLHIKDTGEGLARKGRGKIFNSFTSSREGCTGLGLYFCKSVMQAYHGDITCLGKKGEYALFSLKFPVQNN